MAHRLESEKNTVATMADPRRSPELSGWGATVHGFRFRKHWEREESDVSPFPTINAVGEAVSAEVHDDAMNVPSELVELGLRATIDQTEYTGRKREARRTRWNTWRGCGRSCAARAMELAGALRSERRSAPFREKNRRGGSGRGGELTSVKNGGGEGSNRRDGVRRSRWFFLLSRCSVAAASVEMRRGREERGRQQL